MLLYKQIVPLDALGLPIHVKIACASKAKASGRAGGRGGDSVVCDICKTHFRKKMGMAPAWFSHRGPDFGRVTPSRLLHMGSGSGSS